MKPFYETRIVPAIINVREWLDHMEANDPSPSVTNPYETSGYYAFSTVVPVLMGEYESIINGSQKCIDCSGIYMVRKRYKNL
ncbi:CPI_1c_G0047050.mRNA.1.CDS.1 [Saccharomyces cerevisiae]|nr:CPI_1c_G0047050.mRNA.1.CDS.1 [Saccharomyces cerevisiae]CAI7450023.1 CPI_1c_G0047050.mRNA.1.CDS.1 [Saccharomyces cerevisiae]